MKNTERKFFAVLAAAAASWLAGCFTVSKSEYPAPETVRAGASAPSVAICGFEATYTSYTPVYGYATVWNAAPSYYCGRGRWRGGWAYPETVSTTTYVPQTGITTAYAEKAQDAFEAAGFTVSATNAQYLVDVKFSGPGRTDGDRAATFASWIFSLTTAEYYKTCWYARLKIVEKASGKVVFMKNLAREYKATVWSPIPLFGAESADDVDPGYAKNLCLSSLVEEAVAEAAGFLAAR